MDNELPNQIALGGRSRGIGFSGLTTVLVAATPKCPICWAALMGALGVGSAVDFHWLRPLAGALLFVSVGALLAGARRRRGYGPFFLGLVAAAAIYLCKFTLNYDVGVYLGGAALLGASIWNVVPKRRSADGTGCHCRAGAPGA